jgi:hypothetical protein
VAGFADGVIVESVLVKALLDAPDEAAGVRAMAELTAELADGVRRRRVGLSPPPDGPRRDAEASRSRLTLSLSVQLISLLGRRLP